MKVIQIASEGQSSPSGCLQQLERSTRQPQRAGSPVAMTFDAIPGLELPGKVSRVRAFGENKQGDITYIVTIAPDRQEPRLRWNMTASVAIEP